MRLLYLALPLIISILLGAAHAPACDPLTCPCCDNDDPWGICVCPTEEEKEEIFIPIFAVDGVDGPQVCLAQWCCVPNTRGCWSD